MFWMNSMYLSRACREREGKRRRRKWREEEVGGRDGWRKGGRSGVAVSEGPRNEGREGGMEEGGERIVKEV